MATNTKYKLQGWQQIQITGLATNTKYRAGNKTELDQSQSLGLAAFLPEQPVEFHLHPCQNNLQNQFCNLHVHLKKKTIQTTIKNKHDTIDCHIMSCSPNKLIKKVQK